MSERTCPAFSKSSDSICFRGKRLPSLATATRHRRRDRTWHLAVVPFEECWRMCQLYGMSLQRQFELGWTTPYWKYGSGFTTPFVPREGETKVAVLRKQCWQAPHVAPFSVFRSRTACSLHSAC